MQKSLNSRIDLRSMRVLFTTYMAEAFGLFTGQISAAGNLNYSISSISLPSTTKKFTSGSGISIKTQTHTRANQTCFMRHLSASSCTCTITGISGEGSTQTYHIVCSVTCGDINFTVLDHTLDNCSVLNAKGAVHSYTLPAWNCAVSTIHPDITITYRMSLNGGSLGSNTNGHSSINIANTPVSVKEYYVT